MTVNVEIELFDTLTRERSEFICTLPSVIGRDQIVGASASGNERGSETISRRHATLELTSDGLSFRDHSRNGSIVDGRHVHNAIVRLNPDSAIKIAHYELRTHLLVPLIIKQTTEALASISEAMLEAGGVIYLYRDGEQVRLVASRQVDDKPIEPFILVLLPKGRRIFCKTGSQAASIAIAVNKGLIESGEFEVGARDVIELGRMRLEIHRLDVPAIVCGNPECRLLNEPHFEQNCVWCGVHLAAGGAVSRPALQFKNLASAT